MRMEELSESRYIKGTDAVERYLLNLVQEYFKNSNIAATTSREYIIKKAVERMKEEISFDSIGVLSITLPSGEIRTGAVTITLEDLNGEPLISPKLSAFNVNFGQEQNTACEGNDPRLSNARKPLPHQHEISDVIGLEGILSTITGKVERVYGLSHTHDNQNVLDMLVYTGNNTIIDLTLLETLEDKVVKLIEEVRQEIIDYREEINDKVTEIDTKIADILNQINTIKQYILDTNQEYYDLSKKYTDEQVQAAQDIVNAELEKLFTRDMLSDALTIANNIHTLAGSMEFVLKDHFDFTTSASITLPVDSAILDELNVRGQLLQDCSIETFLEYEDVSIGKIVRTTLPHILFNNNLVDGSIQLSTVYSTNQIVLVFDSASLTVSEEIKNAKVIYNVYAKQLVTL